MVSVSDASDFFLQPYYEFLRSKTRSFQRLEVLTETFVFFPTVTPPCFCSHFNSKPSPSTDRGISTNLTVRIPTLETCPIQRESLSLSHGQYLRPHSLHGLLHLSKILIVYCISSKVFYLDFSSVIFQYVASDGKWKPYIVLRGVNRRFTTSSTRNIW